MITNFDLGGHFPERDLAPPDFVDEHEIQRRKEALAEEEWRNSIQRVSGPIDPNVDDWLHEHASSYIESCFYALRHGGLNTRETLRTMKRDYISFRVEWIEDGEVYL